MKAKDKAKSKDTAKSIVVSNRTFWTILALILAFSLCVKLIRLGEPENLYFDEVYHGFTAKYYLNNHPESYSMYHKNPPGMAVEWTHPPLAKLLMAGSMAIFGEEGFGWRFSSAVFGTIILLFAALLAWELFGSAVISLLTAFLLSLEGLILTQSRIAMNDAHLMAFAYMCLYFYVRWRKNPETTKYLWWAGAGLGLALSCKWSALFIFFIIGLDQLYQWYREFELPSLKQLGLMIAAFVAIPIVIYVASYAHFFYLGGTFDELWRLQNSMWWYHTNLKATHPYMSKPYHWILNLKPVWMHVTYGKDGENTLGNIYNTGNGIILYLGLASVLLAIGEVRKKWNWAVFFCLVAYFMVWVPWSFSPRIMLFYHYAPAVPVLTILLARQLEKLWLTGNQRGVKIVLGLALGWFLLFYPHNTGLMMPRPFVEAVYFIIPSWR